MKTPKFKTSLKRRAAALLLCAVTALGLCGAAAGAADVIDVTAKICPDYNIVVDGKTQTFYNVQGEEVHPVLYNGTTYAPVRAICEAAGLKVDFDSASYTAVLTTQDQYIASTPTASNYITVDKAKQAALSHAGVNAADAVFVKAGLDWDDGKVCYEVEFYAGNTEYDYDIDAVSGAVLSYDRDWDDFSLKNTSSGSTTTTDGLISEAKAKEIALAKAPSGATVVKCKLDRDDGRYVYEVEMRSGRTEYDCEINAVTGVILDWDVDYDD